jgi:Gelsolin repeat
MYRVLRGTPERVPQCTASLQSEAVYLMLNGTHTDVYTWIGKAASETDKLAVERLATLVLRQDLQQHFTMPHQIHEGVDRSASAEVVAFLDILRTCDAEQPEATAAVAFPLDLVNHKPLLFEVQLTAGAADDTVSITLCPIAEARLNAKGGVEPLPCDALASDCVYMLEVDSAECEAFVYIGKDVEPWAKQAAVQFVQDEQERSAAEGLVVHISVFQHSEEPVLFTERFKDWKPVTRKRCAATVAAAAASAAAIAQQHSGTISISSNDDSSSSSSSDGSGSDVNDFDSILDGGERSVVSPPASPEGMFSGASSAAGALSPGGWGIASPLSEGSRRSKQQQQQQQQRRRLRPVSVEVDTMFNEARGTLLLTGLGCGELLPHQHCGGAVPLSELRAAAASSSSTLRVWRMASAAPYTLTLLPEARRGQFTSGDAYVVLFESSRSSTTAASSSDSSTEIRLLYMWLGADTAEAVRAAAALRAESLAADSLPQGAAPCPVVAVQQGAETASFLVLFSALGGSSSSSNSSSSSGSNTTATSSSAQHNWGSGEGSSGGGAVVLAGSAAGERSRAVAPRLLELSECCAFRGEGAVIAVEADIAAVAATGLHVSKSYILLVEACSAARTFGTAYYWHGPGEHPAVLALGNMLCTEAQRLFLPLRRKRSSTGSSASSSSSRQQLRRGTVTHMHAAKGPPEAFCRCLARAAAVLSGGELPAEAVLAPLLLSASPPSRRASLRMANATSPPQKEHAAVAATATGTATGTAAAAAVTAATAAAAAAASAAASSGSSTRASFSRLGSALALLTYQQQRPAAVRPVRLFSVCAQRRTEHRGRYLREVGPGGSFCQADLLPSRCYVLDAGGSTLYLWCGSDTDSSARRLGGRVLVSACVCCVRYARYDDCSSDSSAVLLFYGCQLTR